MPDKKLPLNVSGSVTLVAGRGSVTLGPSKSNETWDIQTASVSVTSNTNEPTATFYKNVISKTTQINGSVTGSFDSDPAFNQTIYPGGKLICEWTNGDSGAVATVVITGEMTFRGVQ